MLSFTFVATLLFCSFALLLGVALFLFTAFGRLLFYYFTCLLDFFFALFSLFHISFFSHVLCFSVSLFLSCDVLCSFDRH